MPTKRIYWLDGIKGISCFFIFFHHFCLGLFPATYYGAAEQTRLSGIDTFLATSPLGIVVNGNFFVHLFILISGYVITYQIVFMSHEKIGFFLFKRYLKLIFPLGLFTIINLLVYFFTHIRENNFFHLIAKQTYKSLESLFIGVLFKGDTFLGGHLWMLNYIFLGGILVAIISALSWIMDGKKVTLIPAIIGVCLYMHPSLECCHFATIFWGSTLCLFNIFYPSPRISKKIMFIILFIAIFFSAFPTGVTKPENFYKYFLFPIRADHSRYYWHAFGSFLIIFLVSKSQFMQSFFSKKIFMNFSKISFWVYLLHGFIILLSKSLIENLCIKTYGLHALLIFLLSIILLFSISEVFAKYVTPIENKLIEKFVTFMNKKEQDNSLNT